jgi:hypothetical protein
MPAIRFRDGRADVGRATENLAVYLFEGLCWLMRFRAGGSRGVESTPFDDPIES